MTKLKEEMIERFDTLEKDINMHDQQFNEFYKTLSKIFNEINLLYSPIRCIGFKQQNENPVNNDKYQENMKS